MGLITAVLYFTNFCNAFPVESGAEQGGHNNRRLLTYLLAAVDVNVGHVMQLANMN